METDVEQLLDGFVDKICGEAKLTADLVEAQLPPALHGQITTKAFVKTLIVLSYRFRRRGQFGRLRTSLFVGTVLLDKKFVVKAERGGLLLPHESAPIKFNRFLLQFQSELTDNRIAGLLFLRERLSTYLAFNDFCDSLFSSQPPGAAVLQKRPRFAIKSALALTHLHFLQEKLGFKLGVDLGDFFTQFDSPEDMASVASTLVGEANESYVLDSFDFATPFGAEIISDEIRSVMGYGRDSFIQHETTKLISLFGYRMSKMAPDRFCLNPPTPEFEYAMRLGLIRAELGASNVSVLLNNQDLLPITSIFVAAKTLVDASAGHISELLDVGTPFERVRLKFPIIPKIYSQIIDATFLEDLQYRYQLSLDLLVPFDREEDVQITEQLNLHTFYRIWQFLRFLALVNIVVLTKYAESHPRAVLNSLVGVLTEEGLFSLIQSIGFSEAQASEFFQLIAADVHDLGYFDLQYRPFLRIATNTVPHEGQLIETPPEIISIPGLVLLSNILRNLQTSNQIRFKANAEAFVGIVGRMIKAKFPKVKENQRVEIGQRVTDVDVVIWEGATLYLIECKHSVPGAAPHEMRDVWEDIERGSEQLKLAEEILSDASRRQGYLAGWFPGTKQATTLNLRIQTCILCSHREFSGLQYEGIPVRDFSSLSLLFGDGLVGMGSLSEKGEVNMYRHKIIREDGPNQADLDDYFSEDSKYFAMYRPFMQPLTRLQSLAGGKISLGIETYKLEMELGQWISHLDKLGFTKEPVEHSELNLQTLRSEYSSTDDSGN